MMKSLACILLLSQLLVFGTLDRIKKAMEKKEYSKAYELILKGYEKEPTNPGVPYLHAKLLFDKSYNKYHLDSARITIELAKAKFNTAPKELKEEVIEEGITLEKINQLHEQIRDSAFKITLNKLSISTAHIFQEKFPNSIYSDLLNYKVDSIEFRTARTSNTKSDMVRFIEAHPTSIFKPQADSILDGMRFRDLEAKGSLKDYYSFHKKYPFSRHKVTVEDYILRNSTAAHLKEKYVEFINFAETESLRKKAADVLYYLSESQDYTFHPNQDSLNKIMLLAQIELYPVIQNGFFGFYDRQGKSQIDPLYAEIATDYKCEITKDDWVFVKDENSGLILTKNGKVVLKGIDGYRSVSKDVGLVERDNDWYLYHKSGFKILEGPVEEAEIIDHKWVKVKSGNKWGLFTFMGLQVAEILYDDIFRMESFWIFKKNNLLAVYTEALILSEIEDRGVSLEFKFDDIELVDKTTLIGFKGERECLLDSTLNFLIPWGNYEIYPDEAGWYLKSAMGYRLYNESKEDLMDRHFSYLESNDGWLTLKTEQDWMLLPRKGALLPTRAYDSIKLVNDHAAVLVKDQKMVLQFISGEKIDLSDRHIRTFQNRPTFLSLSYGETMSIYNQNGQIVVSGNFENATFSGDSLIKVQIRGKQGLLHMNGDWILNPVFNTIDEKDGLILTLIDGKIGCYDPKINELISTEYEARVERLRDYYLAKKGGKYGVIDHLNNEIVSFEYDEINYWNDTTYMVKKGSEFFIIDKYEEPVYEAVESLRLLVKNNDHSVYRFIKNGKYGLVSNRHGKLLAPEFTDIFNIGSEEEPLIFADQHLDKAGFHVVSYVSEKGDLVLSKAYTRTEFDGILCDE
ncbi:WG repeat-containing protein [Ekhidna sp.]|uniref:WG repeat-containing protein n=1 Tax=Ekhidna sp. TaxID=2608089 RepID=UPI0032984B7B